MCDVRRDASVGPETSAPASDAAPTFCETSSGRARYSASSPRRRYSFRARASSWASIPLRSKSLRCARTPRARSWTTTAAPGTTLQVSRYERAERGGTAVGMVSRCAGAAMGGRRAEASRTREDRDGDPSGHVRKQRAAAGRPRAIELSSFSRQTSRCGSPAGGARSTWLAPIVRRSGSTALSLRRSREDLNVRAIATRAFAAPEH